CGGDSNGRRRVQPSCVQRGIDQALHDPPRRVDRGVRRAHTNAQAEAARDPAEIHRRDRRHVRARGEVACPRGLNQLLFIVAFVLVNGLKPMTASVNRRVASRLFGSPVRAASFVSWSTTRGSTLSRYSCLTTGAFSFTRCSFRCLLDAAIVLVGRSRANPGCKEENCRTRQVRKGGLDGQRSQ